MALRAGYYGVKRWLWDKLQSIPDKVDGLIDSNNITGAKNFIPPNLNTGTFLNVVFTNNGGVLNLNGTANATNSVALTSRTPSGNYFYLPIGKYKYTAAPMKTVEVGTTYSSAYKKIASSSNGEVEFEITADTQSDYKLSDGSVLVALYIGLVNTTVYNNVKVYPMIRIASVTDDTFEPYAMTNQQLTARTAMSAEALTIASNENFELSGSVHSIRRFGNICEIYSQFKCLTSNADWTTLASAPKPYKGETVIIDVYPNGGVDTPIGALVSGANGEFRLSGGKVNKYYNVHLMYICEDAAGVSRSVTPNERSLDVEVEEPVVVKKAARKKTTKTEEEE